MRYLNLKRYLVGRFGEPVAKISLDAGLTCPNRDGTLSRDGCIYCDARGSGTGASMRGLDIGEQIEAGILRNRGRVNKFIAYFQSYTNTYAPVAQLEAIWRPAMNHPQIVGLSIGTRPDCLPDDVLDLLAAQAARKEIWLELGLQSASDQTLRIINRGHKAVDFARAVEKARKRKMKVLAHVILGLPGEGEAEILKTAEFISELGLDGVKIHSLYISRDTALARMFDRGEYTCTPLEEFVRLAVLFLEVLPPDMVIHRLTGDPHPETLVAPEWSLNKQQTLNLIRKRLEELNTWQGVRRGAPGPEIKNEKRRGKS